MDISKSGNVASRADGTAIAYTLYRNRDGNSSGKFRRVALVHSLAMERSFWQPVAERLATDATVLVYDCRGHGASGKPSGPYTVELFAEDLASLLDHLGWASTLLAGASMGGCVSLAFAAAYPARTDALALVDTTAWYGDGAARQWAERAGRALTNGMAELVEFQKTRWFGDAFRTAHPDIVANSVAVFLANDLQAYAASCRMLGACDLRASLGAISAPTAVMVGEEDYATPVAMAEAMHRGIAGSSLTVLQGARHLTPLEQPDRIATEIRTLLGRVPGLEQPIRGA